MLDWSNIFNIAFVAGAGALGLFFLVSTIVVAVKGKRKCNAFDVILRISATLAFIAATVMFACAILTMLDGDPSISFAQDGSGATLVILGKSVQLPLVDLFVLLSTTVGSELVIALFICSLAALIVDCLVANKRSEKKIKAKAVGKTTKTPEQLRREAELEKIRKIGESAVKKTTAAAHAANADTDKAVDDAPQADWRNSAPDESAQTGFVGIAENNDDGFDTFDDLDAENKGGNVDGAQNEIADGDEDIDGATEQTESDDGVTDETEYAEQDVERDEENGAHDDGSTYDETDASIETDEVGEAYDADKAETVADVFDDAEETADYADDDISAYETALDGQSAEPYDDTADGEEYPQEAETAAEQDDGLDGYDEYEQDDLDDIEPDRGIYIPEIRTITKTDDDDIAPPPEQRVETAVADKKTQQKKSTDTAKRAASESAATRSKRTSGKTGGATRARKSDKAETAPAEKKLPVTRRYVILDRRNAVNMFGDYLRERNSADKEKLQSSINTIIIE